MIPPISCIYLITDATNGKLYVGQARNLKTRWRMHRNAAEGTPSQSYGQRTALARVMRKRGVGNFTLSILEVCEPEMLDAREAHWIAELGTMHPRGYNLTAGGKNGVREPGFAVVIAAANRGRTKTPEWRAALSRAHTGKKMSLEARQKISDFQRGRKHSAETVRKRSLAMKGKNRGPCSAKRRAAIIAGMTEEGKLRTRVAALAPDVIARSAATRRGKKRTPEQCQRFSEGQKRKWALVPKEDRVSYMRALLRQRKSWTPSEETKQKIAATLRARNAGIKRNGG